MTERPEVTHEHLIAILRSLPTDYTDYGGTVERWTDPDGNDQDCSWGCRWAVWLKRPFSSDWSVCTKPGAPRCGMLTFEHQAGRGCFEP